MLLEMHRGQYILRACKGKLDKVPVEKILLPHDEPTNPQNADLFISPNGTIYANTGNLISESTDGGKTWTSHKKTVKGKKEY